MFHSRKGHTDIKKNTQKFLDHKKETTGRLKALRLLLDVFDNAESKVFLEGHYCEIYYVFNDVFSIVEANLRQKGHKSDLDAVLYILEKILLLLPELIQRRWQFHSIGRIMLKLLHHGNTVKLRREGVRLFLLWFQCLQGNSDEFSQLMYASIIPGFPNPVDSINWEKSTLSKSEAEDIVYVIRGPETEDQISHASQSTFHLADKNSDDWCSREEIQPIFPLATNERSPSVDKLTKFFLDKVLESMSTGIVQTQWTDKRCYELSFAFIFNSFKKYYLPYIFSDWKPEPTLYEAKPGL
ncbi:ral GTPase-activating protein subunit alpha-1-like [Exaiptasia diaphana]|uniref:Uncharacterized protein n=1 Tax=Exaiptasia diaphana TaxID=2652724 RepID=A0A913YHK0_EXADI|nr:ral GTPase-activating protein subunit alpha-1-like [Exaiptasia diaphana]